MNVGELKEVLENLHDDTEVEVYSLESDINKEIRDWYFDYYNINYDRTLILEVK